MRGLVIAVVLVGCAPPIGTPAERQRTLDRADAAALGHQLAALPDAVDAHVTISRAVTDPFSGVRTAASAGAVIIVRDRADVGATSRAATALLRAAVPEAKSIVAVQLVSIRDEPKSSNRTSALAALLAFIATIAGCFAWRERWRVLGR